MKTTILLTVAALIAFAGNSLLARAALGTHAIDPATFTAIRLVSGAAVLTLLFVQQGGSLRRLPGSWGSGVALLIYAAAFSLAYLRLGAAAGALILFGAVQISMLLWSVLHRDQPTPAELGGLAIAFTSLAYLLLPGLGTPDLMGALLMVASGAAWGVYSIRGRTTSGPVGQTAGNFVRAAAIGIPLALAFSGSAHANASGIVLALISGGITSGLGYVLWYRALPRITTTQAATVQLTVPIIAALGAVLFLSETLSIRLAISSLCLLGGVSLAMFARRQ